MGCGGCGNKKVYKEEDFNVKGNYKYLNPRQLEARLDKFKRRFCTGCQTRYDCTYENYLKCKQIN